MSHRLVDRNGVLLGDITVPSHWTSALHQRGSVLFSVNESVKAYPEASNDLDIRHGSLFRTYGELDGVVLDGISIEEFERLVGCKFSPSAAYLRSLLE